MSSVNIFELAARDAYRFETTKGLLTVEDLYKLPLTSKRDLSLDSIAVDLDQQKQSSRRVSFVESVPTAKQREVDIKFEIVMYIIEYRKQENARKANQAALLERRRKLEQILGNKQDSALEAMTPEEIQAELARLSGELTSA